MKEDEVLEIELARKEIPVNLKDETGTVRRYTIREMNGTQRDQYLNSMGSRMRYTPDGKPAGIKDYTSLHCDLIHLTLVDENDKPVEKKVIQSWSSSSQKKLFNKARELNALEDDPDEAEAAAKNA